MIHRGVATFTLDTGKCPRWLFERMVSLGRRMIWVIADEYGPDELVRRVSDPVWFQSLGTVLAFDWNASGLTTILTAAMKEAIRGQERKLGFYICGGKGKTSRKTPQEIRDWAGTLSFSQSKADSLVYNSRMAAKVDSALVQDGYQIYHHCFFFSSGGAWSVVQQGMNTCNQTARRYHWFSENISDLVCEPHSGIASQLHVPALDLTSRNSTQNRKISTELVQGNFSSLMKDITLVRKHSSELSQTASFSTPEGQYTFLNLSGSEFRDHPVVEEDFSGNAYLQKILSRVCEYKPQNYETLVSLEGVGPKTVRALSLVSEVIYGAKPSYEDPARYSFAHGGKDGTPFPVDKKGYDTTIDFFSKVVQKMGIDASEKRKIIGRLAT